MGRCALWAVFAHALRESLLTGALVAGQNSVGVVLLDGRCRMGFAFAFALLVLAMLGCESARQSRAKAPPEFRAFQQCLARAEKREPGALTPSECHWELYTQRQASGSF